MGPDRAKLPPVFPSLDRTGMVPPARRRTPRPSGVALAGLVTVLVLMVATSACGEDGDAIIFDGPMTTTTRPDLSTTTTVETPTGPKLGPWVDVTGNLAGTASECGNMSQVAGRPGTDQVIAGVAQQGLWVTTAGSNEWSRLDAASPTRITNRTVSFVFDPTNREQYWESGSYGAPGVVRTTDGGRTFQALGDPTVNHAEGMSVDLRDSGRSTMLVGGHEKAELYRSTDGGATWADVAPDLGDSEYAHYPLVIDGQTHLLGTNGQGDGGIYRTTDGGATWNQVGSSAVGGPGLLASDGSIYWPLGNGSLAKSTDNGATWTRALASGALSSVSNVVEGSDGRLITLGGRSVLTSEDRGETWRALGSAVPISDAKGVAYSEAGNAVYVWTWDCGSVVPPRSVQRLSLTPVAG